MSEGVPTDFPLRRWSDGSLVITEAGIYDPYGNLAQDFPASSSPSFGYAGQHRYYADATGLDYLKARYYDPAVGRFLSRDPIGYEGGSNLYEYVRGNPVTGLDPSGMFCVHWPSFKECMKGAILNAIRGCLSTSYGPCFACVGTVLIGCIPSSGAYGGCVGVGLQLCGFTCGWSTTRCIIGAIAGIAAHAVGCAVMTRVPCHCKDAVGWGN